MIAMCNSYVGIGCVRTFPAAAYGHVQSKDEASRGILCDSMAFMFTFLARIMDQVIHDAH